MASFDSLPGLTVFGCEPDEAKAFDEISACCGVVPTIVGDALNESSGGLVGGNRCVSVGHRSRVTGPMLVGLREAGVEYLSTRSIGVDHIDLVAADQLGIAVENVRYAPDGVADHTVMLILMAIRHARQVVDAASRLEFGRSDVRGDDLRDLTVGVVGVGSIGTAVIDRLQGFGCRVVASDPGAPRATASGAPFVSLDELLAVSDVVTVHVPLSADTRHLIGRREIEAMKPGAVLVNTARGAVVDTEALIVSIESGGLGGAALDVLEGDESIFDSTSATTPNDGALLLRLHALPQVIVTPHMAYFTRRTLYDTVEQTLRNCLRYERNRVA